MGEIKSTLDLVLEKTKHLSLAPEERQAQERQTFRRKVKGLIQKYTDQKMKPRRLSQELAALQQAHGIPDPSDVHRAIVDLLRIEDNPRAVLQVLRDQGFTDVAPLETVFHAFDRQVAQLKRERTQQVLEELRQQHGISGSALLPHLAHDTPYQTSIQQLADQFSQELQRVKASLFPT
jgi:hypothetical protein